MGLSFRHAANLHHYRHPGAHLDIANVIPAHTVEIYKRHPGMFLAGIQPSYLHVVSRNPVFDHFLYFFPRSLALVVAGIRTRGRGTFFVSSNKETNQRKCRPGCGFLSCSRPIRYSNTSRQNLLFWLDLHCLPWQCIPAAWVETGSRKKGRKHQRLTALHTRPPYSRPVAGVAIRGQSPRMGD